MTIIVAVFIVVNGRHHSETFLFIFQWELSYGSQDTSFETINGKNVFRAHCGLCYTSKGEFSILDVLKEGFSYESFCTKHVPLKDWLKVSTSARMLG